MPKSMWTCPFPSVTALEARRQLTIDQFFTEQVGFASLVTATPRPVHGRPSAVVVRPRTGVQ